MLNLSDQFLKDTIYQTYFDGYNLPDLSDQTLIEEIYQIYPTRFLTGVICHTYPTGP